MITSEFTSNKDKCPMLMISNTDDIIIATSFSEDKKYIVGTIIYSNLYAVGYHSVLWSADLFKPFNGTVTLTT